MKRILFGFLKGLGFLFALLFISAIVLAQVSCPIPSCHGTDIDAWLAVVALAPAGIPGLIWSISIAYRKISV